jgi:hypothetical protein
MPVRASVGRFMLSFDRTPVLSYHALHLWLGLETARPFVAPLPTDDT